MKCLTSLDFTFLNLLSYTLYRLTGYIHATYVNSALLLQAAMECISQVEQMMV